MKKLLFVILAIISLHANAQVSEGVKSQIRKTDNIQEEKVKEDNASKEVPQKKDETPVRSFPIEEKAVKEPVQHQQSQQSRQAATVETLKVNPVKSSTIKKRGFIEGGIGAYCLMVDYDELLAFGGLFLGVGLYVSANSYLALDAAFCYTNEEFGGIIEYEYSLAPLLISWNYNFHLSERCTFRLGPVAGVTFYSESEPEYVESLYRSTMFGVGAATGLNIHIAKRSSIDLGYKYMSNFEDGYHMSGHMININYRWSF